MHSTLLSNILKSISPPPETTQIMQIQVFVPEFAG